MSSVLWCIVRGGVVVLWVLCGDKLFRGRCSLFPAACVCCMLNITKCGDIPSLEFVLGLLVLSGYVVSGNGRVCW